MRGYLRHQTHHLNINIQQSEEKDGHTGACGQFALVAPVVALAWGQCSDELQDGSSGQGALMFDILMTTVLMFGQPDKEQDLPTKNS